MCGIYGFFSEEKIVSSDVQRKNKQLHQIYRRGTESVELGFDHGFFSYTNFPVRGAFNKEDIDSDDILVLLNGELYTCPADISEYAYIKDTYRRKGVDGFKDFCGKFVIVIYDKKKNTLFFVRDYFGKIPLFYIEQDGVLYFSSIPASLLPLLRDQQPNDVAQLETEIIGYKSFDATTYKHLRQLPPNSIMTHRAGKCSIMRLKTELPRSDLDGTAVEDILYDLLVESVTATFRNIEPRTRIGVLVSGIDSYILFKILERHYDGDILAFVFYGKQGPFEFDYDPRKTIVEKTALTMVDFYRNLNDCLALSRGFGRTPIKTYLFAKKIKEKYGDLKVVYCGEGADELFGGYINNVRNIKFKLQYTNILIESYDYARSLLLTDFVNTESNVKSICDFFLRHQLVDVHLNPFNICFQNFLLELRSPYLTEKMHAFARALPESSFENKRIIRDVAQKRFGFDAFNYRKVSLPESVTFV